MTDTFTASVQYDDWQGTVAADDAHEVEESISGILKSTGSIENNEIVIGASFFNTIDNKINLTAFICKLDDAEDIAYPSEKLREAELELTADQFTGLFKRLSIKMSLHGKLS